MLGCAYVVFSGCSLKKCIRRLGDTSAQKELDRARSMKLIMQAPARWRMLCFKEAVEIREAVLVQRHSRASKTVEQGALVGRLRTFRDLLCWELLRPSYPLSVIGGNYGRGASGRWFPRRCLRAELLSDGAKR